MKLIKSFVQQRTVNAVHQWFKNDLKLIDGKLIKSFVHTPGASGNFSFKLIMNIHWHMSRVHVVFMTINYFLYYLYAAQITHVLVCDLYKQRLFTMAYVQGCKIIMIVYINNVCSPWLTFRKKSDFFI